MSQLCLQRLNAADSDVTVLLGPFLSSPSNCQAGSPGIEGPGLFHVVASSQAGVTLFLGQLGLN